MQVHPYLNFDGKCEEAFTSYARILGGTIQGMTNHGSSPIAGQVPPTWHHRIMHARLLIGDQVIMGSDNPPEHYDKPGGIHVSLQMEDPAEADRVYHALADGGLVEMPIQETFWAQRFGMLVDRFGIPWMVNCPRRTPR
jgi:PhnB protein